MNRLNTNLISRKRVQHHRFLFVVFVGSLVLCLSCGKKGPPVPPKTIVPPPVTDLKAEVVGDKVRLTWSMPKKDDVVFEGLEQFRVYKYKAPSSVELCSGCPIPFEHFCDIKLEEPGPAEVERDRIILHDTVEADCRYAYKVVVYHKRGGMSEDSNIVQFVTKP